jgi:DNA-binding protein H-NS
LYEFKYVTILSKLLQDLHDIAARDLAEKEMQKEEERRAQKIQQLENLLEGKGMNNKSSKNCAAPSGSTGTTSKVKPTKSNFRSGKTIFDNLSNKNVYIVK